MRQLDSGPCSRLSVADVIFLAPFVVGGCAPGDTLPLGDAPVSVDAHAVASSVSLGLVTGGIYQATQQSISTDSDAFFCEMNALGTRWIRIQLDWPDTSDETYRKIIDAAHQRGIRVVALVAGSTCAGNGDLAGIDAFSNEYVARLDNLARVRLAGHEPDAWEILNEPNNGGCSSGSRVGGNVFAWLLRRVWQWKTSQNRTELIVSGGTLFTYLDEPWWGDFLGSGAWAAGERPFDLMGVHPYNPYGFDENARNFDAWSSDTRDRLVAVKQGMDGVTGRSDTSLLVTEFGWAVCGGVACVATNDDLPTAMQASVHAFEKSGVVTAALWYDYRDDPAEQYGLRRGYDPGQGRYPAKTALWTTFADLAGGSGGDPEACWGGSALPPDDGGSTESGGGNPGNATVGMGADGSWDGAIADCHARNGGAPAVGAPFDNGGGPWVHGWGPGQVQDFGGGSFGDDICLHRNGGASAFLVRGDIRRTYFESGGGDGWLGYPLEDEHGEQQFEHGRIVWDPTANAFIAQP